MGKHFGGSSMYFLLLFTTIFRGLPAEAERVPKTDIKPVRFLSPMQRNGYIASGRVPKTDIKPVPFPSPKNDYTASSWNLVHMCNERQCSGLENGTTPSTFMENSGQHRPWRSSFDRKMKRSAGWWLPAARTTRRDGQTVLPKPATQRRPQAPRQRGQGSRGGGRIAAPCWADRLAWRVALRARKTWAQQMADSSGHVGAGVMMREMDFVGVKEECLSVQTPFDVQFQTQYCVVALELDQVSFPQERTARTLTGRSMGVCLPDSCDRAAVAAIVDSRIKQGHLKHVNLGQVVCVRQEDSTLGGAAAGMLTFVCLWILVVLASTVVHVLSQRSMPLCDCQCLRNHRRRQRGFRRVHYERHGGRGQPPGSSEPSESSMVRIEFNIDGDITSLPGSPQVAPRSGPKPDRQIRGILRNKVMNVSLLRSANAKRAEELNNLKRLVKCFSLDLNLKKLLDTSRSEPELGCLHGVRVISFVWMVLAASAMQQVAFIRNAFPLFREWRKHRLLYSIIGNGDLSFESLFTVSGLSLGYVYSVTLDKQTGRINWLTYLLSRYWKIVPTMTVIGVMYLAMFPDLVSGPLAADHAPDRDSCLHYGWMNVLLVQNFAPDICMSWTWYLAVDFQLFLFSPVLLLLLYHRPRLAYVVVFFLVLGSCIASGILTQIYQLPIAHFVLPDLDNSSKMQQHENSFSSRFFYKPWAHCGSFFPPLLLGFLLHTCQRRACFGLKSQVVGWLTAVVSSLTVLLGASRQLVGERTLTEEGTAAYNAVHGTVWSLCLCWLVVMCSTGYVGVINSFLSWPGWKPLSRLVFGAYLVFPVVLMTYNSSLGQLTPMTTLVLMYHGLAVLLCSFLLSAVLSLTVEMPLNGLPSAVCSSCVTSPR